jgi:hypothetical protein
MKGNERIVAIKAPSGPNGRWWLTKFEQLQKGDVFMIYEANGDPIENDAFGYINIATEDARGDYIHALPI